MTAGAGRTPDESAGGGPRRLLASYAGFERDARLFLLVSLAFGAAGSLYWVDFNLYLTSLGHSTAFVGLVAACGSAASMLAAFPASIASDRFGRRVVLIGGVLAATVATVGFTLSADPLPLLALAALYAVGQQAFAVVTVPYLTEHSRSEHRGELFAVQYATVTGTSVGAALLGGLIAAVAASAWGLRAGDPGVYRILLVIMAIFSALGVAALFRLRDDRPPRRVARTPEQRPGDAWTGEPLARRAGDRPRTLSRMGIVVRDRALFAKLVIPGFLTSLGAGQVIPFLNVFVEHKFELSLASLNVVFALSAFGTTVAILLQPILAHRVGKVASVVLVQSASIPFILVLGFSPALWSVVIALMVRNSLMNAGNPMVSAFTQEQVGPAERATLAAAQNLLWSLGWVIAGTWYSALQATLGFDLGYTVNFVTITVLYTVATILYWVWFCDAERMHAPRAATAGAMLRKGSPPDA